MAFAGSRYGLMDDTSSIDGEGISSDTYPDILTYFEKLERFPQEVPPLQYEATSVFCQKPYLVMASYYEMTSFEDLILTLNNIPYITEASEGDIIYIPDKSDTLTFYNNFSTLGGTAL